MALQLRFHDGTVGATVTDGAAKRVKAPTEAPAPAKQGKLL
jgi:hypothetical protein